MQSDLRDRARFNAEIRDDRYRDDAPATGSWPACAARTSCSCSSRATGSSRSRDPPFSPAIDAVLDAGTRQLAGRRLLLPKRVAHLFDLRRRQLAGARHAAVGYLGRQPGALRRARREQSPHAHERRSGAPGGGRSPTCPRTTEDWPEGTSFYHYDQIYDRRNARISRPEVRIRLDARPVRPARACSGSSWRSRTVAPLFAEVDLVSSHTPWTRVPPLIDWKPRRRRVDLQPAARRPRPA